MSSAMTPRERVLAAFDHSEPDRVPVWLGASPAFREKACRVLGLDDEGLSLYVGDDFRRVYARYTGPEHASPYANLPPGTTYRSPFGVLRHGYEGGQPVSHPLENATIVAEVDRYPWPNPAWMDASLILAEALRYAGHYAMLGGDWSPFWHDAIDLLGMENLMLAMYDNPPIIDAVLEHLVDFYAGVSRRIFEAAADVIDIFFIGNDFGSQNGPLLGDRQFRRFIVPHLSRLIDLGHSYRLKVLMHCCGGFAPLIPAMIDAGLDGLQALQPNCRGMNPARLKAEFGSSITLMGAINSQLIIEGTPDLVRGETRRILDIMKPGGGYVASPSHDYVLGETPVQNLLAVYEAAREYGRYD
ncbi:MAG TPA: uroporphyrinogen decarboxylase family protein [Aggregatilineaceae bacterium]|jgi:uroporphyrinogen-III decarboxylase|nr:uroporphyrinogen decarboxylase family protein [Aggregatilineaceae bacterium]